MLILRPLRADQKSFSLLLAFSCSLERLDTPDVPRSRSANWQTNARSGSQTPVPQGQPPLAARSHAQAIPIKAPKAPGWLSMASGVDGASTLVFFPRSVRAASFFVFLETLERWQFLRHGNG
jgi:hypothetical protein